MAYQGLAGALGAAQKSGGMGAPRIPLLKTQNTQGQQRVINGSRYGVNPSKAKVEIDDLPVSIIKSLKKGGPINKTGAYKLHKGEYVVPAKVVAKYHLTKGRMK